MSNLTTGGCKERMIETIGVLGGMGPAATVDFYRRIVAVTAARKDQDHIHVLIDGNPCVPDRTGFLMGQTDDPTPMLVRMAHVLEQARADLLVIACNTANIFAPHIEASVSIPVFHWADEVAARLRALQPDIARVGLLATTGTITHGLYLQAFQRYGVNVIIPQPAIQQQVMGTIYDSSGIKAGGNDIVALQQTIEYAGRHLQDLGAQAVLLACTELSLLFASCVPACPIPAFDAAQLAAERVVQLAGRRLKQETKISSSMPPCASGTR